MQGERIETAVQRIETALSRIAELADQGSALQNRAPISEQSVNVSQLVVRHEELRDNVATELRHIDDILARLGE